MRGSSVLLPALLLLNVAHAAGQDALPAEPPLAPPTAQDVDAVPLEPGPDVAAEGTQPDDASQALTDAELAALGIGDTAQGFDDALRFSGFMDVNVMGILNAEDAPLAARPVGTESAFFVGHLNLYATKNITRTFSMMAELRFVYSPNGSQASDTLAGTPSYSQVGDYTGGAAMMRWGGMVIERAYGEWAPWPYLALRIGAFLTPYGIWNVDHGSPVYVPVTRPFAVNGRFFPERQTGIELLGQWGWTSALTVRYHLTLSNGLGPVSEYRDLDANKAIGGRLAIERVGRGTLQIGGSVFYGKNTSGSLGLGIEDDGGGVELTRSIASQAWVTSSAADIQWRYRGFLLQSEWVGQQLRHTRAGRTRVATAGQVGVPQYAVAADAFEWAVYGLVGYRFFWGGVMPYYTAEYQRSLNFGIFAFTSFSKVGLNVRPADAIVIKGEYQFAMTGTAGTDIKILSAQVAWAF